MILDQRPGSDPLGGLRGGVKRSKLNFFRTWSCCISKRVSRMQQHDCKYFTRRPPTLGVQIQLFLNMVMLQIKLKGIVKMQQHGSKYITRSPPPPPPPSADPEGCGQEVKIQLLQAYNISLHTPSDYGLD